MHPANSIYRAYTPVLFGIAALYAVLVIVPFFVLGVHEQPVNLVMGGVFDPKGIPPYSYNQADPGYWLYAVTVMTMLITPLAAVILASALALVLVRTWRSLQPSQRVLGVGLITLGFGFAAFVLTSPFSRLIMYWFLD